MLHFGQDFKIKICRYFEAELRSRFEVQFEQEENSESEEGNPQKVLPSLLEFDAGEGPRKRKALKRQTRKDNIC